MLRTLAHAVCPLILALEVSTAGCGGGYTAPSANPGVSLALSSSPQIRGELLQGGTLPNANFTGNASGDLSSLKGKTLHVTVENCPLFQHGAVNLYLNGTAPITLELFGQPQAAPGHYTGVLKVHVSLDPAGTQPLGNSPISIPYDVTVRPGLSVDANAVTVTAALGDPAVTRTLKATLPEGVRTWTARDVTANHPMPYLWAPRIDTLPDGTVTLTLGPAPAGHYAYTIRLEATAALQGDSVQSYTQDVQVAYDVAPGEPLPSN